MRIQNINNINFEASQVNIAAIADNHGAIASIPQVIKTIELNKDDIFQKSKEDSTLNLLAVVGDYFMYPSKKGLETQKNKLIGDIQYRFLTKLIHNTKLSAGNKDNYDTVFAVGNHDLEAGDEWLFSKLKFAPMTSVITNVDLENSPSMLDAMKTGKVVTSKIYEIPDDKNPDLKNHILVLGVTIPRKKFNGLKLSSTKFIDTIDKNDKNIEPSDFSQTYELLNYHVKDFKSAYPNGAVIVLSHMGNKASSFIANEVKDIDLILNGHDHKKYNVNVNGTLISSLGQNNNMVKGLSIGFNDNGELSSIDIKSYKPSNYLKETNKDNDLQSFVYKNLKNDMVPILDLKDYQEFSEELKFDKNIRFANSTFVNYVTSGLKEAAAISYPGLNFVGIPSEVFRGGLNNDDTQTTFNNLDLIRLFGGANKDLAQLRIGKLSGRELTYIITQNVKANLDSPKENGIIHWSDIQINRSLINDIKDLKSDLKYNYAIKIRNSETNKYEPIDLRRIYTILLPEKYFKKEFDNFYYNKKIANRFQKINDTYTSLFKDYLELIHHRFELTDKVKEQRIL